MNSHNVRHPIIESATVRANRELLKKTQDFRLYLATASGGGRIEELMVKQLELLQADIEGRLPENARLVIVNLALFPIPGIRANADIEMQFSAGEEKLITRVQALEDRSFVHSPEAVHLGSAFKDKIEMLVLNALSSNKELRK